MVRNEAVKQEHISKILYSHVFCSIGAESFLGLMNVPEWTEETFVSCVVANMKLRSKFQDIIDAYSNPKNVCVDNYLTGIKEFIDKYVKGISISPPEHAIAIIALKGILGSSLDRAIRDTELGQLKKACEHVRRDRKLYVGYGYFLLKVYRMKVTLEEANEIINRVAGIEINMIKCFGIEDVDLLPVLEAIKQKSDGLQRKISKFIRV